MSPARIFFCIAIYFLSPVIHAEEYDPVSKRIDFSIGGQLKLDSIYSSRAYRGVKDTNSSDVGFVPATIPLDGSGAVDKYTTDVRGSRLWTTWHVPFAGQDIAGYLEVDFLAGKSSVSGNRLTSLPRLRHYYLKYKALTFGQTFTTFLNVSSFPEINDTNGPLGAFILRQRLLRYRHQFSRGEVILALEDSETVLNTVSGVRLQPNDERFPDIAGKFAFKGDWGNWSLSWLLREIIHKDSQPAGREDKQWGGALNLAGRLQLLERDTLRFSVAYGNVMGRYLSYGVFADGAVDNGGNIRLTPIIGGNIAYQHWWTDTLRTNIALGAAHADNPLSIVPVTENKQFFSSHINLLWSPRLSMTVGVEWLHASRQSEDGADGTLDRIQLTAVYRF